MTNLVEHSTNSQQNLEEWNENNEQQMRTQLHYAEHAHTHKKGKKIKGDLSVVTLQIVLKKKEKEEKKKKEKETKTCGVFLDSACGCCKNKQTSR